MVKKLEKKVSRKQPKRHINYFALFAVIIMLLATILPIIATLLN